jgi:hypothetical protein
MPQPMMPLVVPAKAGTQSLPLAKAGGRQAHHPGRLDPRFRGGDEQSTTK